LPRDSRALTLRTADGVALAAEAWPAPEWAVPADAAVVLVHGFTAHRRDPSVMAMAHELRAAGHAVTRTGFGRRLARRLGVRLDRRWRWTEPPDRLAARLSVPLAVVHGADDRFMPAGEADILHGAGAGNEGHGGRRRLDLVPGMGHAFCTQGHEAVVDAVAWCLAPRDRQSRSQGAVSPILS
jgi:pimeloyl-ACP methyl ester carboxylesterase